VLELYDSVEEVVRWADGPLSTGEVARRVGAHLDRVREVLNALHTEGRVRRERSVEQPAGPFMWELIPTPPPPPPPGVRPVIDVTPVRPIIEAATRVVLDEQKRVAIRLDRLLRMRNGNGAPADGRLSNERSGRVVKAYREGRLVTRRRGVEISLVQR